MDQATQQNAALVEEMAAAASSLKSQAQELVQTVAVFNLGGSSHSLATRTPAQIYTPATPPQRKVAAVRLSINVPAKALAAPKKRLSPPVAVPKTFAKAAVLPAGNDQWESF